LCSPSFLLLCTAPDRGTDCCADGLRLELEIKEQLPDARTVDFETH
jgi:hypothetical protein